jgi:hypothetical protein
MSLRLARRGGLALCLAAALSSAAFAGGLYRWVTKDGRVEVGPFPPAGVNAEPWQPDGDAPKPAPAPPRPRAERPPNPAASETRRSALEARCARPKETTLQREATERKIAQLEATIARLEETLVANEESHCTSSYYRGCRGSTFDRDEALERAQEELGAEQSKLADLERKEQERAADEDCAKLPAAYAR